MILTILLSIVLHVGDSLYVNDSRLSEKENAQQIAVVERLDTVIEFRLFNLPDHSPYGLERFSEWKGRNYTRTGWQDYYDKDGNLSEREYYNRGGHRETKEVYYKNGGSLRLRYTYKREHVELNQYYEDGSLKRQEIQQSNKTTGKCFTESGAQLKFTPFAVQPQFPGGKDAMYAYLDKNIKYPRECRKTHAEGRAIVGFTITEHGTVRDVKILRSTGNDFLDNEAVRLVQEMPRWTPGTEDGYNTDMRQTVSVFFKVKK